MAFAIGLFLAAAALAVAGCCAFEQRRGHRRAPRPNRTMRIVETADGRLMRVPAPRPVPPRAPSVADLTAKWLADDRPAWETVAEFEASVETAIRGR